MVTHTENSGWGGSPQRTNLADIAGRIADADPARITRDFLVKGEHVLRITDLVLVTTQAGKDIAILEADVVESSTMEPGCPVKEMVALSGEQTWRIESNLRQLKSLVQACLPSEHRENVNASTIQKCFATEDSRSALEGSQVKVSVKERLSSKGKKYTEKNWIGLSMEVSDDPIPF